MLNIPTAKTSESRLANSLREVLPQIIPGAEFLSFKRDIERGGVPIDLEVKLWIGGVTKTLLCSIKAKGEPRYVYEALGQLSLASKAMPGAYPVIIVPAISPEGKQLCKQAGVGYIALNNELFLKFNTVYLERSMQSSREFAPRLDRKSRKPLSSFMEQGGIPQRIRKKPFPFSPKASRLLRVFLENPKKSWSFASLAKEAQVAPRLAFLAVNYLVDKLLIKKERGAITLLKPKELLDLWVTQYGFKKDNEIIGFYSADRTIEEFLERLRKLPKEFQDKYALSLYAGATLVAPYLRFSENHLYIQGSPQEWADRLGLKAVESGANTFLVVPYDSSVFYNRQQIKGVSVVSNLQLYLDLYSFNDRAREQAEIIYKKGISFK